MSKRIDVWIGIIGVIVMFVLCIGIPTAVQSFNEHDETITVTDKERVNTRNDSYCLVFGEDDLGNTVVYKNQDNFILGKFDS